jgi:hypothetical protein
MKKYWTISLIALIAEVATVTWRWGHSPTHGIRDWYEGSFKAYFIDSITPWLVAFSVLIALWLLITKIVTRGKQSSD